MLCFLNCFVKKKGDMLDEKKKVRIFRALGNETRFAIFRNLFAGGYVCSLEKPAKTEEMHATCVSKIAEQFDFALPTISRHLKELKEAELVTMRKEGNKIYVDPNLQTLRELNRCFNDLADRYEPIAN